MANAYLSIIQSPSKIIESKIYNVGFENKTVIDLSNLVRDVVGKDIKLITTESEDNRSYHISSKKIIDEINFLPKFSIKDAIYDLVDAFKSKKIINTFENDNYYNIKTMKNLSIN